MMTGASRDSLAASLEAVGPVLDEGGETTTVTATGCEPGPDADDEKLLTETDRTPL